MCISVFRTTDYILSDVKLLTAFDNRILGRCTLCISVGYFLYDSLLSISQLGKFPGRVEIIVHHVITTLTLCLTLFDIDSLGHFLAFCVFGMVIEINNIFIHIRSLMQMAHYVNNQKSLLLYKFNSICALGKLQLPSPLRVYCRWRPLIDIFSHCPPHSFSVCISFRATLLDLKRIIIITALINSSTDYPTRGSYCGNHTNLCCDMFPYHTWRLSHHNTLHQQSCEWHQTGRLIITHSLTLTHCTFFWFWKIKNNCYLLIQTLKSDDWGVAPKENKQTKL